MLALRIITLSVCFYIGYRYIKDLNMKQDKNRDFKVGIVVLLMGAVCYLLFITDELRETIFYCSGILLFYCGLFVHYLVSK
ncbi:hypothetical protein [Faecalitalea cylindroides]|uniref:hypothetical protein n=1 Tax=Faecalitalea cylindroides TaxID=39483 RepID=UPI003994C582